MSKNSKAIIVVLGLFGLSAFACIAAFMFAPELGFPLFLRSNPDSAQKIGSSIIEYTLPDGYLEQQSLNLGTYKMVIISDKGQDLQIHANNSIVLVSFPSSLNISDAKVKQELLSTMLKNSDRVSTMERVGEARAVLRGETIPLDVHESFGIHDPPTRMMFSPVFPGKTDSVMLMFAGPIASWDSNVIDEFIGSIR